MPPLIYTLEVTLVTDDAGSQETFYFSRAASPQTGGRAGQHLLRAAHQNPGSLQRSSSVARAPPAASARVGEIELNNLTGELDDWVD